jgi:DNA-binding CsgD family transcriptional regulator
MFANDREQTQMLAFIGQLYDAAGDPTAWAPMAAKMAAVFGAESCLLQAADLRSGGTQFLGVTDNIPPSFWSAYEAHYYREDQWAQNAFLYPDRALLGEEMGSEDWYRRSEFFNEVCVTAHAHYIIGAGLSLGDERLGLIGIHRPRSGSAFGQDDRRRLEILLPHIARAEALTFRFANAGLDRQASLEGLNRTGTATFVVDRSSRILFANLLAEALLAKPGPLRAAGGRLTCDNPRTASQLGKLIQSAVEVAAGRGADHPGRGLAIDRGVESLPLTALVAPFRPARSGIGAVRPAALVFIRDPEMPGLSAQLLRDLFQLTPAQAAVAQHLGDGRSLHQVAEALGISLHTARAHLQAVFEKTNTTRQPQLAALLARSIAGLDAPSPRS